MAEVIKELVIGGLAKRDFLSFSVNTCVHTQKNHTHNAIVIVFFSLKREYSFKRT